MQPPRPFRGVPYDKDMFTFLPALANRDVLVESPRKRKSMASDSQFTIPAPNMGYGPFGNSSPTENAGDLRANKFQCSVPASSPWESSTFKGHLDNAKFEDQNSSGAPWYSNERDFCESRSEYLGYSSFAGQSQPNNYNDSSSLTQSPAALMYKPSIRSPLVTDQHGSHDSGAHVGGEDHHFHFPTSQSYELQMPALTKVKRSNSSDLVLEESQNMLQNFPKPGAYSVGLDKDSCHEHNYKAETFPKIGHGDSSSFARVDCDKTLGNSFGTSIHYLDETNRILQQALRLLNASSGTSLTINQDGSSQDSGGDAIKIKSTPNFQTQNVSHSLVDGTPSKGDEAGLNLDKSIISGDKGPANVHDGLKSENGGLALAEKLWDGTLQLSSSVSVSAVAFFKSGEKMQDFSWSGSVEVKGKVRLEAFEKYIQDLPRSRSRGLMVGRLGMGSLQVQKEVARTISDYLS